MKNLKSYILIGTGALLLALGVFLPNGDPVLGRIMNPQAVGVAPAVADLDMNGYDLTDVGSATLGTTTTSMLNGVVYVTGSPYAKTSAGINAALTAACDGTNPGVVHVSAGTSTLTTSVVIPENCTLEGDGMDKTIFYTTAGITSISAGAADYAGRVYRNINIKGLTVDMGAVDSAFSYGIVLGSVDTSLIDDVRVTNNGANSKNQLYFGLNTGTSSEPARNLTVQNSKFDKNRSGYESILFAQARNITFVNNTVIDVDAPYALLQYGSNNVLLQGNQFIENADVRMGVTASRIVGNLFASSTLTLTGAKDTVVSGNVFNGGSGFNGGKIVLQGDFQATGSSETGWEGFTPPYHYQVKNVSIIGNSFQNCNAECISSTLTTFGETYLGKTVDFGVYSVSIIGNTFSRSYWAGIGVVAKNATIANNLFEDSGVSLTSTVRFHMVLSVENGVIAGNITSNSSTSSPITTRDVMIDNQFSATHIPTQTLQFVGNDFRVNEIFTYWTGGAFTDTRPSNIRLAMVEPDITKTSTDNINNLSLFGTDDASGRISELHFLTSPAGDRNATIYGAENGNILGKLEFPNITGNLGGVKLYYGSTAGFILNNLGNVGIGTTTPATKLDVYNASATSTTYVYSGGAGLGGQLILEDYDGGGCTSVVALDGVLTAATVTCP